jgi:hypothetical protein
MKSTPLGRDVAALIEQEPIREPRADQLAAVRKKAAELRDLKLEEEQLNERLSAVERRIAEVEQRELPDLFDVAKIRTLGLEAEGNMPAVRIDVRPFYHANISPNWPPERRARAFGWLEAEGHGDMIKNEFRVSLGRGEEKAAKRLEAALAKLGVEYVRNKGVQWNVLTAFVREQVEKHNAAPPLDVLGATISRVAKIVKEKTK